MSDLTNLLERAQAMVSDAERVTKAPLRRVSLPGTTIGLITLERARLFEDGLARVSLPEDLAQARRLTVYLGRQQRVGRDRCPPRHERQVLTGSRPPRPERR